MHLADVYASCKIEKGIVGDVLVETAEDETRIIAKCEWDIRRDEGWGWCGKEGDDHVCDPSYVHVVGSDDGSYNNLVEAFKENRIGTNARVIMLNPIHPDLPPFVVLLQPVCNKFDSSFVRNQWNTIKELYKKHLAEILGPLVGHASDGDSRRRKLHLESAEDTQGERYRLKHHSFIHSAKLCTVNGKTQVEGLADQDFVHNGKKLVNHLLHRGGLALLFWGGVMALKGPVERGLALNGCSHVHIV